MYTLMIKTHETGLKYLCKSERADYLKYTGSGTYWLRHLKKYGRKNISTIVLFQSEDLEEFKKECLKYSILYNVVESNEWANLIYENGFDGGVIVNDPYWLKGFRHSEETKKKIGQCSKETHKRLVESGKYKPSFLGRTHSEESKGKLRKPKPPFTNEHRRNLSKARIGLKLSLSEEAKNKKSSLLSETQKIIYICSVCGNSGNNGHMGRYHKKCQEDPKWKKILKQ